MPKNPNVKRVMVIGSGPIVIGQAAEFDYAGTQACRSLKEEGVEVILVNSNPATIMTDGNIADKVYIEPLTAQVIEQIIEKEKPDSLLLYWMQIQPVFLFYQRKLLQTVRPKAEVLTLTICFCPSTLLLKSFP